MDEKSPSPFAYYILAWKEFKQGRGYKLVKAIHWIFKLIIFTILGVGLFTIGKALYPLLPLLAWLSILLGIALIIQTLVIHFLGRHHDRITSEHATQHKAATSLFNRNSDIIARLNYEEGVANQVQITGGFSEQAANQWSRGIIEYLQHYQLSDLVDRFKAPDHILLEVLPENLPSNPDELRRLRMDARKRLLSKFEWELRSQAINSPYGSDPDSTSLINVSRNR